MSEQLEEDQSGERNLLNRLKAYLGGMRNSATGRLKDFVDGIRTSSVADNTTELLNQLESKFRNSNAYQLTKELAPYALAAYLGVKGVDRFLDKNPEEEEKRHYRKVRRFALGTAYLLGAAGFVALGYNLNKPTVEAQNRDPEEN